MSRPDREDERGAIHHVMIRGVERREIFRDDEDRGVFVDRFEQVACDLGFACDALTLIGNHVHAVIETGDVPLAKLMHRLNFYYAQHFNRTAGRTGHLFEARYKSRRVRGDGGHVLVVAYAIGNPLRHRLVSGMDELCEDIWNAMSLLSGKRPARRFESATRMAALLGASPAEMLRTAALASDSLGAALEPDLLAELEFLIREMCLRHGVPRELLGRPEHRAVRRSLLEHAVRELGVSVTRTSEALGMSRVCAHRTLARGKE
jgi:REP element-mobilizing transposase RayT